MAVEAVVASAVEFVVDADAGGDDGVDADEEAVGSDGEDVIGVCGSVGVSGVAGGGDGGGGLSGVVGAVVLVKSVVLMLNGVVSSSSRKTSGVRSPSVEVGDGGCWPVAAGDPPLLLARRLARLPAREAAAAAFIHFAD